MSKRKSETQILQKNPPKRIKFDQKIQSISDLIKLSYSSDIYNNIDISKIKNIRSELRQLNSLVGLDKIKQSILEQLLYYIQDLHKFSDDYLHTVITGPSGCGKTTIAKILGKIFSKINILSKEKFITARRDTLVAGYLGQTAIKTQSVLDSAVGGVLFIDEIYSLGNADKRDSFSKEAIDTITLFLSEQKHNFMLIVAGYEEEVDNCFFAYNQGLKRRFMWHHKIDEYTDKDFVNIFKQKVFESFWSLNTNVTDPYLLDLFKNNKNKFKFNGGDIEKFFTICKIQHAKRSISIDLLDRKKLNREDINNSIEKFKKDDNKDKDPEPPFGMYT